MLFLLGILPVLAAIGCLLLRTSPVIASAAGLACAVAATLLGAFPLADVDRAETVDYAVLTVEVLAILLFGMGLAMLLRSTGAMAAIAGFIEAAVPSRVAGTALVVFGVVPFAESVTGYGIGVTVGVPILLSLGHPGLRAALLGLLGLIAVPWGALGPGTAVAASLARLDVDELGQATALVNIVPVLVAACAVLWLCRSVRDVPGTLTVLGAAAGSWAGILGANAVLGTPPAGIVGSLLVSCELLLVFRLVPGTRRTASGSSPGSSSPDAAAPGLLLSLAPYGVLTVGILVCRAVFGSSEAPVAQLATSPAVWLAIACLTASLALPGGRHMRTGLQALRAWVPVGTATLFFMAMGWLMSANGMSTIIGTTVAFAGAAPGPVLAAIGSVLTGSNTGANAMFAPTVVALAESAGASTLFAVASANAAGSFAALAAPPRVAMAVGLTLAPGEEPPRGALMIAFAIIGVSTVLLAVVSGLLGVLG